MVPKVVEVFEANNAKLPLATQVLIAVSGFLRNYGIYLLIAHRRRRVPVLALRCRSRATRRRFHRCCCACR